LYPDFELKDFEVLFPTSAASPAMLFTCSPSNSIVTEVRSSLKQGAVLYRGCRGRQDSLFTLTEVTVSNLHPGERIRLGKKLTESDHWFTFDRGLPWGRYQRTANAVLPHLDTMAEDWWNRPTEA
jgi:hypothetical protein